MTIDDYDRVAALWAGIKGFGIRSIDDSREGIERFLRRNPNTSVVAEMDGKLVGSILCGHADAFSCIADLRDLFFIVGKKTQDHRQHQRNRRRCFSKQIQKLVTCHYKAVGGKP